MILTSSIAEAIPCPGLLSYCCAKKLVTFMTEGLHYELKDNNVDCLAWCPGYVATKLTGKTMGDVGLKVYSPQ